MGYEGWSTDRLEQELAAGEAERSRLAAVDLAVLEELDARQVATADGCRSLSEWVASRLDVSPETAKSLVRTMRRTSDRPELREALAAGEIGFDRVEALSRIPEHARGRDGRKRSVYYTGQTAKENSDRWATLPDQSTRRPSTPTRSSPGSTDGPASAETSFGPCLGGSGSEGLCSEGLL
jgi:hypothetical protein